MENIEKIEAPVGIDLSSIKDKPQLVSLLFYNFVNETKENKLNLIDIFDRLYVDINTKISTPFGVFIRVVNALGSPVRCDVFSPENVFTGGLSFSVRRDYTLEDGRKPIQMQVAGHMVLRTPIQGTYWFIVSYEGKVLGACPLLVEHKNLEELKGEHTRGDG